MVRQKNVCVIGAGVAGLVTAKIFKARGHQVTIVERSGDLGGVWEPSRCYPELQTQSPKDLYRYTDKPMPTSYPEWPKASEVHAYLTDYARDHALVPRIRFNSTVIGMTRRQEKPGWTLEIEDRALQLSREDFDFVAVCTGQFNEPRTIDVPGAAEFKAAGGTILHSSEHTDAAPLKGKHVVVLGGSKSATDIAVNAVSAGAQQVTLVYLDPVWRIPYFIGGLLNFKRILYVRAQEEMYRSWDLGLASRLGHALAKPLVWAHWRSLECLLKLQFGLKSCDMVPEGPIEDSINCAVPIATPGFYPMVADGWIKALRGTLQRYGVNSITTTDRCRHGDPCHRFQYRRAISAGTRTQKADRA